MPVVEAPKNKLRPARRLVEVRADSRGNLPDRVELVVAKTWPSESNKGLLSITPNDLEEMKANFDAKIGTPGNSGQLAIDFKHEDHDIAGCWIHGMEVVGNVLYGTELEWTTTGRSLVGGGEFKFLSPSFYPACLGEWHDPEDWSISARNVVVGAAFTNIPYMKDLQPVRASNDSREGLDGRDILYIDADAKGETRMHTFDEVRSMEPDALTDEDKKVLADNQEKLNADEKVKFGFEQEEDKKVQMTEQQKQDAQILADIRDGKKVLVEASEHEALKASVETLKTQVQASSDAIEATKKEKVEASVDAHIKRGAIKADQKDAWVSLIMADEKNADLLAGMTDNPVLAAEVGEQGAADASADAQFQEKVTAMMDANKGMSYSDAVIKCAEANPDLAKQRDKEIVKA